MQAAIRWGLGLGVTGYGFYNLLGDDAHRSRVPSVPKKRQVSVTYFDLAATPGEKLRLACALSLGPDAFVDDRVAYKDWSAKKPTMKYGQMPCVKIDGEEHYQSAAVLRYIGSEFGDGSLYPKDDATLRLKIDKAIGLADDMQKAWTPALYVGMNPQYLGYYQKMDSSIKAAKVREMREKFMKEGFPKYMQYISNMLKENGGPFIAGSRPTIADCRLFPQLDYYGRGVADYVDKDCLNAYPEVVEYLDRVRNIPEIASFHTKQ